MHQKRFPFLTEGNLFFASAMSNSQQPATISQHRMVAARPMPRAIPSVRRGVAPGCVAGQRRKIETHGVGAPCGTEESGARDSLPLLG